MSTALDLPEDALAEQSKDGFDSLAKAGDYLPQLRLVQSSSPLVAQKKAGIGNFALCKSKEDVIDLGDQVAIYPIKWRPLALNTNADPVVAIYDQNNAMFLDFQKRGLEDSNCGYMAGPQFLLWIPQQKTFATFHMSSKTMKMKAKELLERIPKATTLKSLLITKGKYNWYGPVITECSLDLETPIKQVLAGVIQKFLNPDAVEVAPTEAQRTDR